MLDEYYTTFLVAIIIFVCQGNMPNNQLKVATINVKKNKI